MPVTTLSVDEYFGLIGHEIEDHLDRQSNSDRRFMLEYISDARLPESEVTELRTRLRLSLQHNAIRSLDIDQIWCQSRGRCFIKVDVVLDLPHDDPDLY